MADDLEEFTFAQVEVAIQKYRCDPENVYFPRSGQLRVLITGPKQPISYHGLQGSARNAAFEFGDPRPLDWEYRRKQFWKPHWNAEDLKRASDPTRHARYVAWLAKCGGAS
jgi:hypothetical protein